MPLTAYNILIGARNDDPQKTWGAKEDNVLINVLKRYFPSGFTIAESKGYWVEPSDGSLGYETSRIIYVTLDISDNKASKALSNCLNQLKNRFSQHAIMLIRCGDVQFV